jgi:uncharacterized membrane protein
MTNAQVKFFSRSLERVGFNTSISGKKILNKEMKALKMQTKGFIERIKDSNRELKTLKEPIREFNVVQ